MEEESKMRSKLAIHDQNEALFHRLSPQEARNAKIHDWAYTQHSGPSGNAHNRVVLRLDISSFAQIEAPIRLGDVASAEGSIANNQNLEVLPMCVYGVVVKIIGTHQVLVSFGPEASALNEGSQPFSDEGPILSSLSPVRCRFIPVSFLGLVTAARQSLTMGYAGPITKMLFPDILSQQTKEDPP